jgi:PPOX class probable F420-dependent enzyme
MMTAGRRSLDQPMEITDPMRTDLRPEDLGDLLDQPLIAVLATRRKDDSIMLSPVWFEWYQGGIDVWVPTIEGGKVAHVRRDPRVTVVVANQEWPYKGFELRGEATISTDPDVFYGVLGRTALRYDGPEAAERMVSSYAPGAVIRVEPGVIRAWDYEDEA